ncbi:hypothetical protein ACMYR3_02065 [Ampullimonas aquatilis]|uniref:hypothetical protein n=1 Tax=Ampullimonas aquatilis TaxID=1341549 RepID=UPI003C787972
MPSLRSINRSQFLATIALLGLIPSLHAADLNVCSLVTADDLAATNFKLTDKLNHNPPQKLPKADTDLGFDAVMQGCDVAQGKEGRERFELILISGPRDITEKELKSQYDQANDTDNRVVSQKKMIIGNSICHTVVSNATNLRGKPDGTLNEFSCAGYKGKWMVELRIAMPSSSPQPTPTDVKALLDKVLGKL